MDIAQDGDGGRSWRIPCGSLADTRKANPQECEAAQGCDSDQPPLTHNWRNTRWCDNCDLGVCGNTVLTIKREEALGRDSGTVDTETWLF